MCSDIIINININRALGLYKCISAYDIPSNYELWLPCRVCNLRPLIWEFDNGRSTACACGDGIYKHFSICAESIMSYITRNDGSTLGYDTNQLLINWNNWVEFGIVSSHEDLVIKDRW